MATVYTAKALIFYLFSYNCTNINFTSYKRVTLGYIRLIEFLRISFSLLILVKSVAEISSSGISTFIRMGRNSWSNPLKFTSDMVCICVSPRVPSLP